MNKRVYFYAKTHDVLWSRDAHFPPGPQFPASPSPFGDIFLGKNREMGRDGDENHPQMGEGSPFPHFPHNYIEMGMGMGMGERSPIPISPFPPNIYKYNYNIYFNLFILFFENPNSLSIYTHLLFNFLFFLFIEMFVFLV